jgi:hypothetical protein
MQDPKGAPTLDATENARTLEGADVSEDPQAAEPAGSSSSALYLYGVGRTRSWRPGAHDRGDGVRRLRFRGLEALVRVATFETPELSDSAVLAHQRVLDAAMRRGTILPAPFGIVFRDRRQLLRMLQDEYDAIAEGLDFLEGHWELRLHIGLASEEAHGPGMRDLAMQLYTELRRTVRAAVPFPHDEPRLLSAAFLVERSAWLDFMQRADDLSAHHPEIALDITGPWPAYDFVRIGD